MIVTCINDKKLPEFAEIVEGQKYEVLSSRTNNYGQKILFLKGIRNNGTTSKGLQWNGYDATRFKEGEDIKVENKEFNYALN